MKENITKFMMEEHGKMLKLYAEFKKKKTKEAFVVLDGVKQRHVLAEEKAIMMLQSSGRTFSEMTVILEQHEAIGELMDKIREAVKRNLGGFEKDLDAVINLMKKHVEFENKKFYPKLDKELDEKERKVIYSKLHDAIIGNIMI